MKVQSLSHVGITVRDFASAARWYREVFGCSLLSEDGMDKEKLNTMHSLYGLQDVSVRFGFLRSPGGGLIEIFDFSETREADPAWNRPGTSHLAFAVKGVPAWYDYLEKRGDVKLLCKPQNTDGNLWFFFRDPDGNLVELIDLKMNYPLIRYLGGLLALVLRKTQFKEYYRR